MVKQTSDVRGMPNLIPDGSSSFQKRTVCEKTQEADGIKKIGFARIISPSYASERPKPDINIHQILKA
jgi:hypothetical protein